MWESIRIPGKRWEEYSLEEGGGREWREIDNLSNLASDTFPCDPTLPVTLELILTFPALGLCFNITHMAQCLLYFVLVVHCFIFPTGLEASYNNYNVLPIFLPPKKHNLTHNVCIVGVHVGYMLFLMGNFMSWWDTHPRDRAKGILGRPKWLQDIYIYTHTRGSVHEIHA